MGPGKVMGVMIGLVVGLLIGGPWAIVLFIVVGLAAGHYYDEQNAPPPDFPELFTDFPASPLPSDALARYSADTAEAEAETRAEDELDRHLCALFLEVARADGDVRREEVREVRFYFEETLHADARTLENVRGYLKAFLSRPASLDAAASIDACRDALPSAERLLLVDALYNLALADGPLQRSEREALRRVAEGLELSEDAVQELATRHLGDGAEHYARLGVAPDASDAEVKTAFRRLAAAHHPDKVSHLGPHAVEQAALRFQEVRDAYEEIRRLRGL